MLGFSEHGSQLGSSCWTWPTLPPDSKISFGVTSTCPEGNTNNINSPCDITMGPNRVDGVIFSMCFLQSVACKRRKKKLPHFLATFVASEHWQKIFFLLLHNKGPLTTKDCLVLSCQRSPLPFRAETLPASICAQPFKGSGWRSKTGESRRAVWPEGPRLGLFGPSWIHFQSAKWRRLRAPPSLARRRRRRPWTRLLTIVSPAAADQSARLLLCWTASRYECVTALMWPWWPPPTKRTSPS